MAFLGCELRDELRVERCSKNVLGREGRGKVGQLDREAKRDASNKNLTIRRSHIHLPDIGDVVYGFGGVPSRTCDAFHEIYSRRLDMEFAH